MSGQIRSLPRPSAVAVIWSLVATVAAFAVWVVWDPAVLAHSDADTYEKSARQLLDEGFIGEPGGEFRAWRGPGNTILIAGTYALTGRDPDHEIVLQILLFGLTIGFIAATARVLSGNLAGHIAGLAGVLYMPFYIYVLELLSEAPHFLLLAAGFYLLAQLQRELSEGRPPDRRTYALCAGTGFVFGLSAFVKAYAVYLPLAALAVLALVLILRSGPRAPVAKMGVVAICAFAVAVAPWVVRNWIVVGSPTVYATNGSVSFLQGNYALKYGDWRTPTHEKWYPRLNTINRRFIREAGGDEVKYASLNRELAMEVIQDHPGNFARKFAREFVAVFTSYGRYEGRLARPIHLQWLLLVALALAGAAMYVRRYPIFVIGAVTFVAYLSLQLAVVFGLNRLKEPLAVPMLVLGSLAVAGLWSLARAKLLSRASPAPPGT